MIREAHTAVRVMQNPESFWRQHGKACIVDPMFAAEAFTEAMTIRYTEIQQSISVSVFYPQSFQELSSINFTGLCYLKMSLISQKGL